LSTLSPYSDERDQLSTALFGTSEILKVDPEGRVILTEPVKEHAGIGDAWSSWGWAKNSSSGSRRGFGRISRRRARRCGT
jgi:DNA-binding transcriptional regulator/RsmH inhibitor MraZ